MFNCMPLYTGGVGIVSVCLSACNITHEHGDGCRPNLVEMIL